MIEGQRRSVGLLFAAGIVVAPWVFAWLLLRRGHSTVARVLGFAWLALLAVSAFNVAAAVRRGSAAHPIAPPAALAPKLEFKVDPSLQSLVSNPKADRDGSGGVLVTADVALPDGTAIMVDFGPTGAKNTVAHDKVKVSAGSIRTASFSNKGRPWLTGDYSASFLCRFDAGWQSPAVLSQTGENGSRLPRAALRPIDPDLPAAKQDHLEMGYRFNLHLGDIGEDEKAIDRVKTARLSVPDRTPSQSNDPVEGVVKLFADMPAPRRQDQPMKLQGWSAKKGDDGTWVVTLAFVDNGESKRAEWSFSPRNGQVHYVNHEAKLLSWSPNY